MYDTDSLEIDPRRHRLIQSGSKTVLLDRT